MSECTPYQITDGVVADGYDDPCDNDDDAIEEDAPGRIVLRNTNNSNLNSELDVFETPPLAAADPDLVSVMLAFQDGWDSESDVNLDQFQIGLVADPASPSKIKLWDTPTKDHEIPLGLSPAGLRYFTGDLPPLSEILPQLPFTWGSEFFVEGLDTGSGAVDLQVWLLDPDDNIVHYDYASAPPVERYSDVNLINAVAWDVDTDSNNDGVGPNNADELVEDVEAKIMGTDGELVEGRFNISPVMDLANNDYVAVLEANPADGITLWETPAKTNEIKLFQFHDIHTLPTTFYVEGHKLGKTNLDLVLFTPGGSGCGSGSGSGHGSGSGSGSGSASGSAPVTVYGSGVATGGRKEVLRDKIIFAGFDLSIDSNNDGTIQNNPKEPVLDEGFDPGAIVHVNNDFDEGLIDTSSATRDPLPDNSNSILDRTAEGVQDLEKILLNADPDFINSRVIDGKPGELKLWKSGRGKIRLFSDANSALLLDKDYTTTADIAPWFYTDPGNPSHNTVKPETVFWIEGVEPGHVDLEFVYDPGGRSAKTIHKVRLTVVQIDLNLDNDDYLDGPCDGVANYLPGYKCDTPMISPAEFRNLDYEPQKTTVLALGLGTLRGISQVRFDLSATTSILGFAENGFGGGDPAQHNTPTSDNDQDFSFERNEDESTMAATVDLFFTSKATLWVKDYGGSTVLTTTISGPGIHDWSHELRIPLDLDNNGQGDGLPDKWERQAVRDWNSQFGEAHPIDNAFFDGTANQDNEPTDPDGDNADGGSNLPLHKNPGDSLTLKQEYRGYVLDGGRGVKPDGTIDYHLGKHKRLSPAFKELLVEADLMISRALAQPGELGLNHMPTTLEMQGILNSVSAAFADLDRGAGIHMYWVIDDDKAEYETVWTYTSMVEWFGNHRDTPSLDEFVHLGFGADIILRPWVYGDTGPFGAAVHVESIYNSPGTLTFHQKLVETTAHELTHSLLDVTVSPFDTNEHLPDATYASYLMHSPQPYTSFLIKFSNPTRKELSLTSKESVERRELP